VHNHSKKVSSAREGETEDAEIVALRVKLTHMAQELQEEILQYQAETSQLQQFKKQQETALRGVSFG
jgi:nitrogen fixation/metabolism regulation signal transduction histidine kinase